MIPDVVDGKEWHPVYSNALKTCHEKITKNVEKIQKRYESAPFNIPKGSCDVKYMAIFFCMQMDAYSVRSGI